jgi:nitroimidazol reductase NimA-like FMN-containing flavoprotein (pyridoxamine 5'-phosphate oxidase superfamily)
MAPDLADEARRIIDATKYMALGTADGTGHPWVSPVWFATVDRRHFHWVSGHQTRHSRNLEARQEIAIAIYDPSMAAGSAGAVYISGTAKELTGAELEEGIEIFGRLSRTNAGRDWKLGDVQPPAPHRLYRATALEYYVLIRGADSERGRGVDHREPVEL